jgi:hypothetical protein
MPAQVAKMGSIATKYIDSGASISECGQYRYLLWRAWAEGPRAVWIMLNPSTADGAEDDQTIRKCVAFAKRWGLAGIEVVNLFAYRATDPKELKPAAMAGVPGGYGITGGFWNDQCIINSCLDHDMVICGWGNNGSLFGRSEKLLSLLGHTRRVGAPMGRPRALKVTKLNQPSHPLYLSLDLVPFEWDGRASSAA